MNCLSNDSFSSFLLSESTLMSRLTTWKTFPVYLNRRIKAPKCYTIRTRTYFEFLSFREINHLQWIHWIATKSDYVAFVLHTHLIANAAGCNKTLPSNANIHAAHLLWKHALDIILSDVFGIMKFGSNHLLHNFCIYDIHQHTSLAFNLSKFNFENCFGIVAAPK